MEEFEPVKNHFDSEIMSGTNNGIETCVVKIPYQIGFANYAYIAPDFDLNGERIETIDDCGKMHRLAVTVLPESNQSYILLSCLSSEEKIYHDFFEQIKVSVTSKVLYYFNLLLPLFSENLVISEKLWDNHSEKGQFGLVHMAALIGTDQFNLSHTIGMALRNAAKNKKMDYSKRGEIDLFQTIQTCNQHKKLVLSGVGGLGKTELTKRFLDRLVNTEVITSGIEEIAWIPYDNQSICISIQRALRLQCDPSEVWQIIQEKATQLQNRLLLVIDNVENPEEDEYLKKISVLQCNILVTSRQKELQGFSDILYLQ